MIQVTPPAPTSGRTLLVLFLATGLAMSLALVVYWASLIWRAPPDDEALRLSVSRTGATALTLAFTIDPNFCSLRGRGWFRGGEVKCPDVPVHLFKDRVVCEPGQRHCKPEAAGYTDCVSYEWTLDILANPSSFWEPIRKYDSFSSGSADCNKGWTPDNVRRLLAELGLTPLTETVVDFVTYSRRR